MSCLGLLTFTTTNGRPWRSARARNRLVGAFHRFHGNASPVGHDHSLADVFAAMWRAIPKPYSMSAASFSQGRAASKRPVPAAAASEHR